MISIFIKRNLQDMERYYVIGLIKNKNYLNLFKYIIYIYLYIFLEFK